MVGKLIAIANSIFSRTISVITSCLCLMISLGGKPHPKEKELQKLKEALEQSPKAGRGVDQPDGVGETDSLLSSEEEGMRSEEGEEVQGRQERRPKKPRKTRGKSINGQ